MKPYYSRARIHDEFSDLPISRQRKWQLRKRGDGKCGICGAELNGKWACAKHMMDTRKNQEASEKPERRRARRMTKEAIRSGKLIRQVCEIAGCDRLGQAHHEDYFKPLDITWLCHIHHCARHGKMAFKERPVLPTILRLARVRNRSNKSSLLTGVTS